MKTILYAFKDFDENGGAEKNLIEVAKHAKKNNNVLFLVASGYDSKKLKILGRIFSFPSKGKKIFFIFDVLFILYLTLKYKIDIIHSHHRYPSFIASTLKPLAKFKLLTTVHNVFPDKENFSSWGEHAIAVSRSVYDWVISGNKYNESDISVVYNGILTPQNHTDDDLAELKKEISYNSGYQYLCTVGRLSEQKNYSLLFDILSAIDDKNWRLLLVGNGEQKNILKKLSIDLHIDENIIFMGQRNDIDKIMQISDLFLLSSKWEGFPYVVIEALSNGLPVLSTDVGGIHEAISNNNTGFLFKIKDTKKYKDTLNMVLKDNALKKSMSINCVKIFEKNFTISEMLRKTDSIYKNI
ncbi:MAG: glycosyltransferase [Pseudomonadota bacterium]